MRFTPALSVLCLLPHSPAQETAPAKLTLDDVFALPARIVPQFPRPQGWLADGKSYLAVDTISGEGREARRGIVAVDAASGTKTPYVDAERMEAALAKLPGVSSEAAKSWSRKQSYSWSASKDAILLNEAGDLFCYRVGDGEAFRLTSDPAEEVGETFSPDGKLVAFVSGNDLHVVAARGGPKRALTTGGSPTLLNGRLDWVYQEEIYGRGNWGAYWWSPDSAKIAFLTLDETPVPEFVVVDHMPLHQGLETMRYPKAGDPNPKVSLSVVPAGGGAIVPMDLAEYAFDELLIVRVAWTPDAKEVIFQVQNRIQTWLDLLSGDPATGKAKRLFRDTTAAWIGEPTDAPFWRKDGKEFLWLSERSGYQHFYLYAREGKLIRPLTDGPWEADTFHGIDEAKNVVYFSSDKDDVKGSQLYRVALDGSGLAPVTKDPGTHNVSLSPNFDLFVDTYNSSSYPGRVDVCRIDGTLVRNVVKSDPGQLSRFRLTPPEFVQVKTRDGFTMEAFMIKPPNGSGKKPWPTLVHTYAGPHAPQARDQWGGRTYLWHQMLAQEGYLVWVCDNRSASGKGHESARAAYRNFGATELADIEDGIQWLVEQGHADKDRIGIWGWSYGGYMCAYAMTHSTRFKAGISGAPVTDWRLYDSIYTERYMDLPQRNPEGYDRSSVIKAAANLHGRMLLIHGTIDENVHVQNTIQLVNALQAAGKQFDLMLYPRNRHGVVDPKQSRHMFQMMTEFVRKNL